MLSTNSFLPQLEHLNANLANVLLLCCSWNANALVNRLLNKAKDAQVKNLGEYSVFFPAMLRWHISPSPFPGDLLVLRVPRDHENKPVNVYKVSRTGGITSRRRDTSLMDQNKPQVQTPQLGHISVTRRKPRGIPLRRDNWEKNVIPEIFFSSKAVLC